MSAILKTGVVIVLSLAVLWIVFRFLVRRRLAAFERLAWVDVETKLGRHKRVNRLYAEWIEGDSRVLGLLTLSDKFLAFQPAESSDVLGIPLDSLKYGMIGQSVLAVGPLRSGSAIFNVNVQGQGPETALLWSMFWRDIRATAPHVSWAESAEEFNALAGKRTHQSGESISAQLYPSPLSTESIAGSLTCVDDALVWRDSGGDHRFEWKAIKTISGSTSNGTLSLVGDGFPPVRFKVEDGVAHADKVAFISRVLDRAPKGETLF